MYLPLDRFIPWLLAFEKPVLILFSIKITDGNFNFTISVDPSIELLSITITSPLILSSALNTEFRHCSKK
jgi:hypothetical protein